MLSARFSFGLNTMCEHCARIWKVEKPNKESAEAKKKEERTHTNIGLVRYFFFFVGYNVNILEQNIHWVYYVNEACALFFCTRLLALLCFHTREDLK